MKAEENDSWKAMMKAVQAFHDKHDFKNTGGEELNYRVALMAEELGEISSCVTKGKVSTYLQRKWQTCSSCSWVPVSQQNSISTRPSGTR